MNILWLSHVVPYPPTRGVLLRSYNLLVQVSKKHKVYLLALNQKSILPDCEKIEEARLALSEFCEEIFILPLESMEKKFGRLRLLFWNLLSMKPYDVNWTRSAEMAGMLDDLLRSRKIDLVHFDTIGLAQYRKSVHNIPKILNHHNIESQMMSRRAKGEKNPFKRLYFTLEAAKLRRYEKDVCHHFSVNTTVSDLDGERLREINPRASVGTVSNGVDIEFFKPCESEAEAEINLLNIGGLNWYPNKDAVMYFLGEIWPELHAKFPRLKVNIVGECPRNVFESIMRNRDNMNIVVTGFVDDVKTYFHRATIFICPMRTGGGTRLKILDALASGKAIVATSIACEGIDVTRERNIMIADTPNEFQLAIGKLLSDQDLRVSMGREARRLAEEKYSWIPIGEKLCATYDGISLKENKHGL